MEFTISARMKELRQAKGNTQEQLADHMGITTQAVSKWERSEGYPDITLLPAIAAFYNVSVDYLLGTDEARRKGKVAEYNRLADATPILAERVRIWRRAYHEFPNDPYVIQRLIFTLRADGIDNHSRDIISLAEKLLNMQTQSGEYFGAINSLSLAYKAEGNMQEAKRYAAMSGRYIGTENQLLIQILEGEEAACVCRWNIETIMDLLSDNAATMLLKGSFSDEEYAGVAETMISLIHILCKDGNLGVFHCHISQWYMRLARCLARMEQWEQIWNCLELSMDHAKKFDRLSDGRYTSAMLRGLRYEATHRGLTQYEKCVCDLGNSTFDPIREDARFKGIVSRVQIDRS